MSMRTEKSWTNAREFQNILIRIFPKKVVLSCAVEIVYGSKYSVWFFFFLFSKFMSAPDHGSACFIFSFFTSVEHWPWNIVIYLYFVYLYINKTHDIFYYKVFLFVFIHPYFFLFTFYFSCVSSSYTARKHSVLNK